ncbi:MAG: RNA polymerase sigma factor [Roseiflexaceae bacterium]
MILSDHDLMARVRERNVGAFEALCERYGEPLRRHLLRMLRDADAAEDLLQETLLRMWTHAAQWDGRGAPRAWLFRIATNLALNHVRTLRRRRQQPLDIPPDPADPDEEPAIPGWMIDRASLGPGDALELAERLALLRRLVAGLPEEKREVLRLIHDAEMEIGEVAQTLGIPPGTVKSRLHYATQRLAREWRDAEGEG